VGASVGGFRVLLLAPTRFWQAFSGSGSQCVTTIGRPSLYLILFVPEYRARVPKTPPKRQQKEMRVYRLEPIKPDDPSWEASTVKETVWVWATDDKSARDKVAGATLLARRKSVGVTLKAAQSPWRLYDVTSCKPDPARSNVPPYKPITRDGRVLPRL
jgi:hypothetical protein